MANQFLTLISSTGKLLQDSAPHYSNDSITATAVASNLSHVHDDDNENDNMLQLREVKVVNLVNRTSHQTYVSVNKTNCVNMPIYVYVTGFWKANQIVMLVLGLFYYIAPANSYVQSYTIHAQYYYQTWLVGLLL